MLLHSGTYPVFSHLVQQSHYEYAGQATLHTNPLKQDLLRTHFAPSDSIASFLVVRIDSGVGLAITIRSDRVPGNYYCATACKLAEQMTKL